MPVSVRETAVIVIPMVTEQPLVSSRDGLK